MQQTLEIAVAAAVIVMVFISAKIIQSARRHPVRQGPPQFVALRAAPELKAVAAVPEKPALPRAAVPGDPCEGPGCGSQAGPRPWTADVEGDETEHRFCSEACALAWKERVSA